MGDSNTSPAYKPYTITGIPDPDTVDNTARTTWSVTNLRSDLYRANRSLTHDIKVYDTASEGIRVSPTYGSIRVGQTVTYNIRLYTDPGGSVTVRASKDTGGDANLILVDSADSTTESTGGVRDLVFTSGTTGNWDEGFDVYIHNSGTEDGEALFKHAITVAHGDYKVGDDIESFRAHGVADSFCLLYTSPSPRD